MTLRQKQSKFASMVALLIQFAYEQGYEITFGDAWAFNLWFAIDIIDKVIKRFPATGQLLQPVRDFLREHSHSRNSFHYKRLAIDLNLFEDGRYLESTEAHRTLGMFWESLGGTWGGKFGDGNHYSFGE